MDAGCLYMELQEPHIRGIFRRNSQVLFLLLLSVNRFAPSSNFLLSQIVLAISCSPCITSRKPTFLDVF